MTNAMRISRYAVLMLVALGWSAGPARAQLGSRAAEEWIRTLESPARIESLKIDETVAHLKLKPGDVVADIGAGSGIFEAPLARAVGPSGKVYAEDVDQGLVDAIARKQREFQIPNIMTVLGQYTDPMLPASDVDLAMINDVLHHIADRATYLKNLARYIEPSGRIALIEYYPEKGGHRTQPELQVTKDQAAAWMADAGFRPVEEIELFAEKYFVIYARR
jgi:ubiquinone/menaquinone biosynthesis C-methylase UbiE